MPATPDAITGRPAQPASNLPPLPVNLPSFPGLRQPDRGVAARHSVLTGFPAPKKRLKLTSVRLTPNPSLFPGWRQPAGEVSPREPGRLFAHGGGRGLQLWLHHHRHLRLGAVHLHVRLHGSGVVGGKGQHQQGDLVRMSCQQVSFCFFGCKTAVLSSPCAPTWRRRGGRERCQRQGDLVRMSWQKVSFRCIIAILRCYAIHVRLHGCCMVGGEGQHRQGDMACLSDCAISTDQQLLCTDTKTKSNLIH